MYGVGVQKIADHFHLEVMYKPDNMSEKQVHTVEVHRPGLQLSGYIENFVPESIQLLGKMEMSYLETFERKTRRKKLDRFMDQRMPCIIVSRSQPVYDEIIMVAKKYQVPVLRTDEMTSRFLASLVSFLNIELAERVTIHGELLEVYGEGILITGESGVGKSETALELVKRGHRLIADDVVELRKVSERTLLGASPEAIRYLMELRGIGIIDVKSLYGVGAVKQLENISLVINLELWDENKTYERVGLAEKYRDMLGIQVPSLTIPVRPGRNLAIIVEVAAMNLRQISMGYHTAKAMKERIDHQFSTQDCK